MGRSRYAVSISEEMPLGYKIYEPTHEITDKKEEHSPYQKFLVQKNETL